MPTNETQEARIKLDGYRFGWLADGRWPMKFWEAFQVRRDFTRNGPMTTICMGPLVLWIYWHYRTEKVGE